MGRPWEISGDDLNRWSLGVRAPERLPALVRRLLFATTPLTGIEMRADGGTRQGGPDGLVTAREETAFCPAGQSVWELSVEGNIRRKLDEDFKKRTTYPGDSLDTRRMTYVAVTARRFAKEKEESKKKKITWAREKLQEGRWADVRLYDADDLAMWIEQAPTVARWFAVDELLRPFDDMQDVEDFLRRFSQRTRPALPRDLVLTGEARAKASKDIVEALLATDERLRQLPRKNEYPVHTWKLSTEWSEEALLFVAAALSTSTPATEGLLARTAIVESHEALEYCLRSEGEAPLLLLPRLDRMPVVRTAQRRVQMVLPAAWHDKLDPFEGLRLDSIPIHPLARALEAAGFEDAERHARDAYGRISKLLPLLGTVESPREKAREAMTERAALLLVGAWVPTREADREVLRRLGADPEKAERVSLELSVGENPEMEWQEDFRGERVFKWVSPRVAWKSHGHELTDSDLNRFFKVALEMLTPPPRAPAGDKQAQIREDFERRLVGHSGAITSGLASSLAWLAVSDEAGYLEPTHPSGRGSEIVEWLVRELLKPDVHVWSSLARIRELAEAAPRQFLKQLEDTLDHEDFDPAALAISAELLWALETLAWNKPLLTPIALLLARLCAFDDKPKNIQNRPINSLLEILNPILPQSNSSPEERIATLRLLFERHADIAWTIGTRLLAVFGGLGAIFPTPRPRYRRWVGEDHKNRPTWAEIKIQVDGMVDLLLDHVGEDPQRWAELVHLPHSSIGWRVLDALQEAYSGLSQKDEQGILWDAIREELGRLASTIQRDKSEAPSEGLSEWWRRLDELYDAHAPADFVVRHRWLFDHHDGFLPKPVPGGYEANLNRWNELRQEAIEALWKEPDPWDTLNRLAKMVKRPHLLGFTLAKASYVQEIEGALLETSPNVELNEALKYFWTSRLWGNLPRLELMLKDLVLRGASRTAVDIALFFPAGSALWDLLDRIGDPVRAAYWAKHDPLWVEHLSAAEYARGLAALIGAGRPEVAAEAACQGIDKGLVNASQLVRILEAIRDEEKKGQEIHLQTYQIEPLFLALDRDASLDPEQIISLEIAHAERLYEPGFRREAGGRGARAFYDKLKRSPSYFVDILRRLRRPKGDLSDFLEPPKDAAGLERQHLSTLLYHWTGYPGEGLPIPEREAVLEKWCNDVLREADEPRLQSAAVHNLESILARVDVGEDGHWPCLTARRLIESGQVNDLGTAKFNSRGWKTRSLGEGGDQERALAQSYQADARALRAKYPKTAEMLDAMAKSHFRAAERDDAEARQEHIEYGEDERPAPRAAAETETTSSPDAPLTRVEIRDVGPAPEIAIDLAPRLNLFTGDNSLGKTFVLEVLWWVLTGKWTAERAVAKPKQRRTKNGKIAKSRASIMAQAGGRSISGKYNAIHERWSADNGGPLAPGLVIYARVDGGFSIWDPIRNATPIEKGELDLSAGYHFTQDQLWRGQNAGDNVTVLCRGLLEDILSWRSDRKDMFELLESVLRRISPPGEAIRLGNPARLHVKEAREYPTLLLASGEVIAEHASASIKRMLGLAYALVWAVSEIRRAAPVAEVDPLRHVTLLVDELEAHLHPKWQRQILRALLRLAEDISPQAEVQLVVTTHAPLILVSIEKLFDAEKDALFDFDFDKTKNVVVVEREVWELHGDVNAWLSSEVFDETKLRSPEAEKAIEEASRLLDEPAADKKRGRAALKQLVENLDPKNPFLHRWRFLAEKKGWLP